MANKAAMILRAANWLGLRRLNQALAAEHNVRIGEAYDEVYAQLKQEGLANWATNGSVPDELVPSVAALMADNCLDSYGVSEERFARIKAAVGDDGEMAKLKIRSFVNNAFTSQDEAVDY